MLLLASLGFIAYFIVTNWGEFALLRRIQTDQLAFLIFINVAYLVVHARRLQIVLEKCSERVIGYGSWFRIYIIGRFLNLVVPQLGNIYRGTQLKAEHKITYTRYVGGMVSFSWMGAWVSMALALLVILSADRALRLGGLPAWLIVLALNMALVVVPVTLDLLFRATTVRGQRLSWLHAKLAEVLQVSVDSLRDVRYLVRFLLLGVVLFGLACAVFYLCFLVFGIEVGPAELVLFYVLLQIGSYVSLTPGNVGVQEIAFGVLGEQMGISMADGILVAALMRLAGYIAIFALALPMGGLDVLSAARRSRNGANAS